MRASDSPPTARRQPTSTDVAKLAKVSQATVSRVFSPGCTVPAETQARVRQAASTLGYVPNRLPALLHGGSTGIVAVVAGGLGSPYHAMALDSILTRLTAAGRFVKLVRAAGDQTLDDVVAELRSYRVDFVISALGVAHSDTIAALEASGVPLLRLNPGLPGRLVRTVTTDNGALGAAAAQLMIEAGCRRPAFLAGPGSAAQQLRGREFARVMQGAGLSVRTLAAEEHNHAGGLAAAAQAYAQEPFDALLCGNDLIACGAIDALRAAGVQVGRDVRVIGCDNIPQGSWPPYALTTFDQRVEDLADAVMQILSDGMPSASEIIFQPELIRRASA